MPYAESIGAFKELQDEGKVRWVGVSNANVEQIEEALAIVDVVSVQNQLALDFTSPLPKGELAAATERGLAFLPWSPLGGIGNADGAGRFAPVTRRGGAARRLAAAGRAGVAARARPDRDPDPGLVAPGDDRRLRPRRRARAERRRGGGDLGGRRRVSFAVRFPPQPETDAARGVFRGRGRWRPSSRLRVQDYERIYAVPGLYEEVVQRRLGCRTPDRMAALLAAAAAQLGREPASVRILDVGAGNGVSGEALAARGMRPVVGLDILPAARDAALRDRPGVYDAYLAADLCALTPAEEQLIRDAAPNTLACVGSVGGGHLPAEAVAAALELLPPDALVAYAYRRRAARGSAPGAARGRPAARPRARPAPPHGHRRRAPLGGRRRRARGPLIAQAAVRTLAIRRSG